MIRKIILFLAIVYLYPVHSSGQVKVRIFSLNSPESALFSVTKGKYEIDTFIGENIGIEKGEPVLIVRFNGKLVVKSRSGTGFICDSVIFRGVTGDDYFSLRISAPETLQQHYSGNLHCLSDMGTIVFVNNCDTEKYIAGVVIAEGGSGKNIEYFKSQAVIARTYMYKYFNKHLQDGYNVCDNTHCQAFNGTSNDTILNIAASETSGLVILDKDSSLITAAFHSNCGGETSPAEYVWLTSAPYLNKVIDPYCTASRNAVWEKSIPMSVWVDLLKKPGSTENTDDPALYSFSQRSRVPDYKSGNFTLPLKIIRTELNLRSTFFSVVPQGDTIKLVGRGYGHGVGLCQEGAMAMAAKGFDYKQIIDFYYFGVIITDIKNSVPVNNE